ncbi:MAG TPA: hypothetical protein VLH79_09155 [Chthonomonadales bacterium]|nr:hypothetical protein [Chthonomonadales bacterium]
MTDGCISVTLSALDVRHRCRTTGERRTLRSLADARALVARPPSETAEALMEKLRLRKLFDCAQQTLDLA